MNIKVIKVLLYLFFSSFAVSAQQNQDLPILQAEDEFVCGLRQPSLIQFDVSVIDGKNNNLKSLTYLDFEIYDEKEIYEIAFFKFDALKDQYLIGIYEDDFINQNGWQNMKIKLKLSKEKRENYEKVFIRASKAYRSDQN